MGRKKALSLDTLIPQYAENKAILDDYKKICDTENKQIKDIMEEGSYEAGGYKATKSVQVRENMNEDKLLDVMHNHREVAELNGIIKIKEYIDIDMLESAIYNKQIDKDMLMEIDKCRETKEVVTLRISKVKEENNNV